MQVFLLPQKSIWKFCDHDRKKLKNIITKSINLDHIYFYKWGELLNGWFAWPTRTLVQVGLSQPSPDVWQKTSTEPLFFNYKCQIWGCKNWTKHIVSFIYLWCAKSGQTKRLKRTKFMQRNRRNYLSFAEINAINKF